MVVEKRSGYYNRLDRIPAFDGQTDGRTDGHLATA